MLRRFSVWIMFLPITIDFSYFMAEPHQADRLIKSYWVIILIVAVLSSGVNREGLNFLGVISVYGVWLVISIGRPLPLIGLTYLDNMIAFFGYSYSWLLLLMNFSHLMTKYVLSILRKLPLFSVVMGVVLEVLGLHPLFRSDFGVSRLQGALTPALLGLLCVGVGTASVFWQIENRRLDAFFIVNLLICLLTGTRNAALMFILLILINFYVSREYLPKSIKRLYYYFGVSFAMILASELIVARLNYFNLESARFTSGRYQAWRFYSSFFWEEKWFGNGLGFSSKVNERLGSYSVTTAFASPHNSWLQLLLDIGIVGLAFLLILVLVAFTKVQTRLPVDKKQVLKPMFFLLPIFFFLDNYINAPYFNIPFMATIACLLSHNTWRHDNRTALMYRKRDY